MYLKFLEMASIEFKVAAYIDRKAQIEPLKLKESVVGEPRGCREEKAFFRACGGYGGNRKNSIAVYRRHLGSLNFPIHWVVLNNAEAVDP